MRPDAHSPGSRAAHHAQPTCLRTLLLLTLGIALSLGAYDASRTLGCTSAHTTPASERFLEDLERRAFQYFLDHTDPHSGLTRDRAPRDGTCSDAPASIAASGFALSAWCIGTERNWISRDDALRRCLTTLRFIEDHAEHTHGWLYHFIDQRTGRRVWQCEASTIDTALLLKGALLAREYFQHPELTTRVNRLYSRIDWHWALNGGDTLTHGWRPETGFIPSRWDSYSEHMGLYLLGIGAPHRPLPASTWHAWQRPVKSYANYHYIYCGPLFTHQYSHAWFDFRNKRDAYADYWQNSVKATLAQREWCAALRHAFPRWSHSLWGLTASDSAHGYRDWGGPLDTHQTLDGTLVPCAAAGSLPFAPRECLDTLLQMRATADSALWDRYGFADAYNPHTGWTAPDVIAIDLGITLLMAENHRSGLIWNSFMQAPEVRHAFASAGFTPVPNSPLHASAE